MMVAEWIKDAEYIYSVRTKWGLKKYKCDVNYFTDEPIDDLSYVICSILVSNNKVYDKTALGVLLGFSILDQNLENGSKTYYDKAEAELFDDILQIAESKHLIVVQNDEVHLTNLGRISFEEEKIYQFYRGTRYLYEHQTLNCEDKRKMEMFPFYRDMGVSSSIQLIDETWPNDDEVESIIYDEPDDLSKRLMLQADIPTNFYKVERDIYFDLETKLFPVNLYKKGEEYLPVIMNGDEIATEVSGLISNGLNDSEKERLILECLFQQLWDDSSSVLNYKSLKPYFDLINYEALTEDKRIVWTDKLLLRQVIRHANPTCWKNISRNCNLSVLYNLVSNHVEDINWQVFTERVEDDFLIDHFLEYPWDLETLSGDRQRKDEMIEKLILLNKKTIEEWNWDALGGRLSETFVFKHLDLVKVDLACYTVDTKKVRSAILKYPDKSWDYNKIEKEFALDFILENISLFENYFMFEPLFDRVFIDAEWANRYATDSKFQNAIRNTSSEGGTLSVCVFNNRNYQWTPVVINFFMSYGLIIWESTEYTKGFECNSHLCWDADFFSRYSEYVTTDEGKRHVSSAITNVDILLENDSFDWNWNAISSNENIIFAPRLFSTCGHNLNWTVLFSVNQDKDFIQRIENLDEFIGDDEEAWSSFSKFVDIDFVKTHYLFGWDWKVLTGRMFEGLKLEKIGNEFFIDKWDWNYLSGHVDLDFLRANLNKYRNYWDWMSVFPRVLDNQTRLDPDYLDSFAETLDKISDSEKRTIAWSAFTLQYSFTELKGLIKVTAQRRNYRWDMKHFCQHPDFNVYDDLSDCRDSVDWDMLSSSEAVNKSFTYVSGMKVKRAEWINDVLEILTDEQNKWNFKLLSHFQSLRDQRWFVSRFKDKVDWCIISLESTIFSERDKEKLNEIITEYKDLIDYKVLSQRDDIDFKQIIKINPNGDYDYNILIQKGSIDISAKLVEDLPKYDWDWYSLTSSKKFVPDSKFLEVHMDKNLNWEFMSNQDNHDAWSDARLLQTIASNPKISDRINWHFISSRKYFPIKKNLLLTLVLKDLDWNQISQRKRIINELDAFADFVNWRKVSDNKHLQVDDFNILDKYKEKLDWSIVCSREDFTITNDVLDRYADYIDWTAASRSTDIVFSISLAERYKDKWNWPVLVNNRAFHNVVNISKIPHVRENNIVRFVNCFGHNKPTAYHFTHMSNAIKIIKTMKLQSRNYANGNFTNSAGSNVDRTTKAHKFARFYFAPKSPTQFYNEFLGKDRDDLRYYNKARDLKLPKCPLPVFFVFDIEELLMSIPDSCYYSDGNMQKDCTHWYKVIEDPSHIKAKAIFEQPSKQNFAERQQEFLVEGELDFSKLNNVQIFCSDSYQAEMLNKEVIGTKWENAICVNQNLYEYRNKRLEFEETEEILCVSTSYANPFEFKVVYDNQVPTILNQKNVLRQRDHSVYLSRYVEINKQTSFELYFEVSSPRKESWLIYSNRN